MDQQAQRGRSPSAGHQPSQPHINQSHSPSPSPYSSNEQVIGLGLGLDPSSAQQQSFDTFGGAAFLDPQQQQQQAFAQANVSDPAVFAPNNAFAQSAPTGSDTSLPFNTQSQPAYLSPNLNDGSDFSLFPPAGGQGDHFSSPLFEQPTLNPGDMNNMTSPQTHHSPTPPHMFQQEGPQPGSAHHSPAFNQHQFSSPPATHSRHVSLGPEAALLPNQLSEWSQPQFQGHRRTPSEYSDVSSVAGHSPHMVSSDVFEGDPSGHSPLQRPSDGSLYQEVLGIGSFSLSDPQHSPGHQGRSPSHSPAISPRIVPQQMPDMSQQPNFGLAPNNAYGYPNMQGVEAFPSLQNTSGPDMSQMAPPAINIDYAPSNAKPGNFEVPKPPMDQDSLTPPDRGKLHK